MWSNYYLTMPDGTIEFRFFDTYEAEIALSKIKQLILFQDFISLAHVCICCDCTFDDDSHTVGWDDRAQPYVKAYWRLGDKVQYEPMDISIVFPAFSMIDHVFVGL